MRTYTLEMSTRDFDPRSLPVEAFARQGGQLAGDVPVSTLHRLSETQAEQPTTKPAPAVVHWSANGEWRSLRARPAEVWLHLAAHVTLALQCQRCLAAVTVDVQASRSFMFVHGEAQAAALDEQTEDDVLPLTRSLDLISLVEDELLLALPLVPHHRPSCPDPLPMLAGEIEAEAQANPFAALAALNRPGGKLS